MSKELSMESIIMWLQDGIDLETRRIEIRGEVNDAFASKITRALIKLSEISEDPIELYLSSEGGEVYAGVAIYDAIRACVCDVNIIASGQIMSAAFIIYLAGDQRTAAPHTSFMMHSVSYGAEGPVKDHEIQVIEAKAMNNKFLDICAERTKPNKRFWYRHFINGRDKYFDVTQAKELGIITVPPVKKVRKAKNVRSKTKRT